jgi:methionyl-tRNA synthetase
VKDTFYITSAIYYVNDVPHIGHTYEILACDLVARYHRMRGEKVWFLTGTDEHSQNVIRAAAAHGISPQEWTDRIVGQWQEVFERLAISNDDWIRTSEQRHVDAVQRFLQVLYDNDTVYLGTYEGLYCISCEAFKTEEEIEDGKCKIHLIPLERISEDNYFFKLSRYQDDLLRLYEEQPDFVRPDFRRNEIVSFVQSGLRDLSISRNQALWGVPIPWDPGHVTYVWVDALLNYITAPGFGADEERFRSLWPADVHMVGKDIVRFHAVIWPAMLMAAGVDLPRQVFGHGWVLTPAGEKMSKSRGTGIHPFEVTDRYGVDAYRYYFLREGTFGRDVNFSSDGMSARYTAELANGLGNLASRVLAMTNAYFDGRVPEHSSRDASGRLAEAAEVAAKRFDAAVQSLELHEAMAALDELSREANRFLVDASPWTLARDPARRQELADALYEALEGLRQTAVLAWPAMPGAAERLWEQLGLAVVGPLADQRIPRALEWGGLEPGTATRRGAALFPRLEE